MVFVLDTSIIIDIERGNEQTIKKLVSLRNSKSGELCITFINYAEVYIGLINKKDLEKTLSNINSYRLLNTDKDVIERFVRIKDTLSTKGTIIPDADLWIAAICITNDITLITKDKDFDKIKELEKIFF